MLHLTSFDIMILKPYVGLRWGTVDKVSSGDFANIAYLAYDDALRWASWRTA